MEFDLISWLRKQTGNANLDVPLSAIDGLVVGDTREWLVTNGLGSFASGAITGANRRRHHGLLIAALKPPVARTLFFSRIDEVVAGQALATNHWVGGSVSPEGYKHLVAFAALPVPTWVFAVPGGYLVKQLAMQHGQQQVTVGYTWVPSGSQNSIEVELSVIINARDFHSESRASGGLTFQQSVTGQRVKITNSAYPNTALSLAFTSGTYADECAWYSNYQLPIEHERGLGDTDDAYRAGVLRVTIPAGSSVTLHAGLSLTSPDASIEDAVRAVVAYQTDLIKKSGSPTNTDCQRLVIAADAFVVHRNSTNSGSVIAGYHWFNDWGRDSMISLPGLTLATGRFAEARSILTTFRKYLSEGMLPNNFPDQGQQPDYNTADATLLWAWAMAKYVAASSDVEFVRECLSDLESVVDWHLKGTRYNLHVDPIDGLLTGGAPNVQLTWMDAKCGDYVVTPRGGKPVEINALWFNYLMVLADFRELLSLNGDKYRQLADRVKAGFSAFWNAERGCLYDVINEDGTKDGAIRPNQLFALSLQHELISGPQAASILWVVESELLTPHGLRSLSPYDQKYQGLYGQGLPSSDQYHRDVTYHQGTVWSWLIGPWVDARMRVHGSTTENVNYVKSRLSGLRTHLLSDACVGNISEIFDGNAPHKPQGCIAQAWGVAELLRLLTEHPELR